jgi:hypothetical protein
LCLDPLHLFLHFGGEYYYPGLGAAISARSITYFRFVIFIRENHREVWFFNFFHRKMVAVMAGISR